MIYGQTRILQLLKRAGKPLRQKFISTATGIPRGRVAKSMTDLARQGLVVPHPNLRGKGNLWGLPEWGDPDGPSDRVSLVASHLREHGPMTLSRITSGLGLAHDAAQRALWQARRDGLVTSKKGLVPGDPRKLTWRAADSPCASEPSR